MNTTDTFVWTPTTGEIEKEKQWIIKEIDRIGLVNLQQLTKQASVARTHSYSPYSHYQVGVALLASSGKIYPGCNAEVASYSESDHAEESAITGAIVAGEMQTSGRKFIQAVAVSHDSDSAPCGRCRQIIHEHCDNALIITADSEGNIRRITSVNCILPYAFGPSDLGIE